MSTPASAVLSTQHAALSTPEERARYAVDGKQPRYLAEPASLQEAATVLKEAAEAGLAVIPRGGGTKMGLGNVPRAADLVLSTHRLGGILDYTPADLTVTVGAGLRFAELQETLGRAGQFLALDPPQAAEATIGGIVAANASGPRRLRYGGARDLVIGVRVAQTDGTVTKAGAKVVKNVAGYDLNKLYVGSLGTLVLLGEISFKLTPRPEVYRTLLCVLPTLAAAAATVARILHSPLSPTALEIVEAATARTLPALRDAAPADEQAVVLLAEVDGFPKGVERSLHDVEAYARAAGATTAQRLDDQAAAALWDAVREAPAAPCVTLALKAAVPVAAVASVIDTARQARVDGAPLSIISHAGSGIVALYTTRATAAAAEDLAATVGSLRQAAVRAGGSLVVERGPLPLKALLDVWGDAGPAIAVMRRLKETFDSRGSLNPGRFVGGI